MTQKIPIIGILAKLYDYHKRELCLAVENGTIPLSDNRFKEKVSFLKEIASTLSVVYQVEKLRTKDAEDLKLPDEQIVKDPALEQRRGRPSQPPTDLRGFPGTWQP